MHGARTALLTLIFLAITMALPVQAKKPLEGAWQSDDRGTLTLSGDGTFTWEDRSGKWFLDGTTLFLHTPGNLIGYRFRMEGDELVLSGGPLHSGSVRFEYASGGSPVSPESEEEQGEEPLFVPIEPGMEERSEADSVLTLRDRARKRLSIEPLHGLWIALNPNGFRDTLRISATGRYYVSGDGRGKQRIVGDRLYVQIDDQVREHFFLIDKPLMALGRDVGLTPRVYRAAEEPQRRSSLLTMDELQGRWRSLTRVPVRNPVGDTPATGVPTMYIDNIGRITGEIFIPDGDMLEQWGAFGSVVGDEIELRYDDGALESVPIEYVNDAELGRILEWNGYLFKEEIQGLRDIGAEQQLGPYDASVMRRRLQEALNQSWQQYYPNR